MLTRSVKNFKEIKYQIKLRGCSLLLKTKSFKDITLLLYSDQSSTQLNYSLLSFTAHQLGTVTQLVNKRKYNTEPRTYSIVYKTRQSMTADSVHASKQQFNLTLASTKHNNNQLRILLDNLQSLTPRESQYNSFTYLNKLQANDLIHFI